MAIVSNSFTATGNGPSILIPFGSNYSYSVSGTFVGTVVLEKSGNNNTWMPLVTATTTASGTLNSESPDRQPSYFRFRCSAFTSGTIVTTLTSGFDYKANRVSRKVLIQAAGVSKVGATSGFTVAAASNIALVTCAASQTAATCVIPITALMADDIITGFYLLGQIESAGGVATLDADLRKHQAVAADVTDASVGTITQISVTADAAITEANSKKVGLMQQVAELDSFYVLLTATTAASTDIAIQAVVLTVDRLTA